MVNCWKWLGICVLTLTCAEGNPSFEPHLIMRWQSTEFDSLLPFAGRAYCALKNEEFLLYEVEEAAIASRFFLANPRKELPSRPTLMLWGLSNPKIFKAPPNIEDPGVGLGHDPEGLIRVFEFSNECPLRFSGGGIMHGVPTSVSLDVSCSLFKIRVDESTSEYPNLIRFVYYPEDETGKKIAQDLIQKGFNHFYSAKVEIHYSSIPNIPQLLLAAKLNNLPAASVAGVFKIRMFGHIKSIKHLRAVPLFQASSEERFSIQCN